MRKFYVKTKGIIRLLAAIVALAGMAGCSPPAATMDLIAVARKGLSDAQATQVAQSQLIARQMASQQAALDAAFDADVKLAAAGRISDRDGKPMPLTAEWIVSARKGYIAARDAIAQQSQAHQAASLTHMDNLQASDEALDMAGQLILQQQGLNIRLQQQLMEFQRKAANGK